MSNVTIPCSSAIIGDGITISTFGTENLQIIVRDERLQTLVYIDQNGAKELLKTLQEFIKNTA